MKLTNYMRDAFVRRVMADVPSVDYEDAIRKALTASIAKHVPNEVMKLWGDDETSPYIKSAAYHAENVSVMGPHYATTDWDNRMDRRSNIEKDALVTSITQKKQAQDEARNVLEQRLKAVARGASTRKQLAEALPEFEKYLPADEPAAIRSLPVVANVVAEFVAAGWPKPAA